MATDPSLRLLVPRDSVRTPDHLAGAVLVRGERIAAVLRDPADAPRGAEREELDGCLLPGFTDAHVHFPSWALARVELRLFGVRSAGEAVAAVAAALDGARGGWLRGRGWRDAQWPEPPTRQALDAVCGDVPVALRSHDGHSLWLSSAALARADAPLDVPGGVVERDAAGEPTGVLREEAAWAFFDRHAEASPAQARDAMAAAFGACAAAGVVAIHDKDGGRGAPERFAELGEVPLRVWQSVPADRLDDAGALGAGYVKAFMDGALGSRTAWMLDGSGVCITDADGLADIVRRSAERDLPVAVHAIGDRANREALDAFARTRDAWAPRGLRPRIEHAQCVAPEDVPRFGALGIAASIQPTHATSDRDLVDDLWRDRLAHAYPFASLARAGAVLAGGSDAPVEELDPLAGLRAAVLRTDDERPAWRPQEALEPLAAVRAFTSAPAWLEGAERERGSIAPGLLADLVLLDRDPLADGDALRGARPLRTMLGGRWLDAGA